jgi:GTP:adenosylcobinamide-phosphate guanylyltransferase
MHEGKTTAIVMAGRRSGHVDPLAAAAGLDDKCVVPVAGRPMIGHVLAALGGTPEVGQIIVSLNDPATVDDVPEVHDLRAQGRLIVTSAQANLVDSLLVAVREASFPVFITTADNVLLTPETASAFLTGATAAGADVAVAFARRQAVLDAHPEGQRRFYRFADDAYSNCNSYWLGTSDALRVAETFRSGGQFAKHPLRIVQAFGLLNLIRFRYGIGTLDAAFRRFSRRFKLAIHPVILSDGAAAIDVDNARTLAVAEVIFAARSGGRHIPVSRQHEQVS